MKKMTCEFLHIMFPGNANRRSSVRRRSKSLLDGTFTFRNITEGITIYFYAPEKIMLIMESIE
jgi:hypothetical protein